MTYPAPLKDIITAMGAACSAVRVAAHVADPYRCGYYDSAVAAGYATVWRELGPTALAAVAEAGLAMPGDLDAPCRSIVERDLAWLARLARDAKDV